MDRDPAFFLDMLSMAREILALTNGMSFEEFERSKLHHYAVVKLIENIGEAARMVSPNAKQRYADIPWVAIIDMRNHLVHRYFRIDLPLVWNVVQDHLQPLIAQLEPLIPPE